MSSPRISTRTTCRYVIISLRFRNRTETIFLFVLTLTLRTSNLSIGSRSISFASFPSRDLCRAEIILLPIPNSATTLVANAVTIEAIECQSGLNWSANVGAAIASSQETPCVAFLIYPTNVRTDFLLLLELQRFHRVEYSCQSRSVYLLCHREQTIRSSNCF